MHINITNAVASLITDALCSAADGKIVEAEISLLGAESCIYLVADLEHRNELIVGIHLANEEISKAVKALPAAKPFSVRVVQIQGE